MNYIFFYLYFLCTSLFVLRALLFPATYIVSNKLRIKSIRARLLLADGNAIWLTCLFSVCFVRLISKDSGLTISEFSYEEFKKRYSGIWPYIETWYIYLCYYSKNNKTFYWKQFHSWQKWITIRFTQSFDIQITCNKIANASLYMQ